MKAVVLAAGEGRRLEPLTNRRPKPMLPVAGRPLLEYVVEAVADAGIDEVVVVVGYSRDRIQTYFGDGDDWDVDVEYAVQEKQLGTAHAVLQAEPFVESEFVVLNGDRIIEGDCVAAVARATADGEAPALAVSRTEEPRDYGVVELDGDEVAAIREKPREATSNLINAGVYGFDESIFDAIRRTPADEHGEIAITETLASHLDGGPIRAVRYRGLWEDVSHLWDVTRVTGRVLSRDGGAIAGVVEPGAHVADDVAVGADTRIGTNATVRPECSLGDNVTVGANAVLANSVVLPDAVVGDGTVLRDSVVAGNAHVGPNVTVGGGPADLVVDGTYYESVTLGAVVGDNAHVGAGSVLAPGTVVGDGARVEAGSTVAGRIPPDAEVRRG